ncbi:MAG: alpha-N-arabinofuranosidase [Firmicutes bacterium]|nr:alpha-N-arabinofuranosidase [Bacillota bacterium]
MTDLFINEQLSGATIEPEVYGHFSEHLGRGIYGGIYVGEDSKIPNVRGMRCDVVEALRELKVPSLRWPGGCFADEYHWKDGIGPKESRKKMINTHWGGVTEDNSFGTHEYFELCEQLGCKSYINGNLGSGTVQEMSEWVEYMTFGGLSPMAQLREQNGRKAPWAVDFFGVGNENWGCGGNMRPAYYADLYRRYQTYVRNYSEGRRIQRVCCGANVDDYEWTQEVLKACFDHAPAEAHGFMDYLSLHYYVHPGGWDNKGSATDFSEEIWYETLSKAMYMRELVERHSAIMDTYDPEKKIGLSVDEWGAWYDPEPGTNPGFLYQQNTVRDALVAGITLNIFNKHAERVRMAALAQMVNVLQAVILTEGSRMLRTPTYHVMHLYRHHQGAKLLSSSLTGAADIGGRYSVPQVSESVSQSADGTVNITLANLSATDSERLRVHFAAGGHTLAEARIVCGESIQSHNTFDEPQQVTEQEFRGCTALGDALELSLPAHSVVLLRVK